MVALSGVPTALLPALPNEEPLGFFLQLVPPTFCYFFGAPWSVIMLEAG